MQHQVNCAIYSGKMCNCMTEEVRNEMDQTFYRLAVKERDYERRLNAELTQEVKRLSDDTAYLTGRVAELAAALSQYGQHSSGCRVWAGEKHCDCGLWRARNARKHRGFERHGIAVVDADCSGEREVGTGS